MNNEINQFNSFDREAWTESYPTDLSNFGLDVRDPMSSATEKDNAALGNPPEHLDLSGWENIAAKSRMSSSTPSLETGQIGVKQAWLKQFGSSSGDDSSGIATDKDGNIYLTGRTEGDLAGTSAGSSDVWLAKYDSSGKQLWIQQFGSAKDDWTKDIAIDSNNNVYLTGFTYGNLAETNAGSSDSWLIKYDSNGNQIWTKQFGSSSPDYCNEIAIDNNNNVYLTGITYGNLAETNAGSYDTWVAKYDSNGNQSWTKQFGGSSWDDSHGITTDTNGNVYLTVYTYRDSTTGNSGEGDTWLIKYDNTGKQLWTRQFGSSGSDESKGVTTDSNGNIYLTGKTKGDLAGTNAGDLDGWIAKYNSDGDRIWTKQFGTYSSDYSEGITTDSSGNIYLTGMTGGNLAGNFAGYLDGWVAKYNSDGDRIWIQQFGGSFSDLSHGIATDSNGNVYLTGQIYGNLDGTKPGQTDVWIAKFNEFYLPTVTIAATDPKAAETATGQIADSGKFTITRTGDTTDPLTVNYTIYGKATNGIDYTKLPSSITIPAGKTQVSVSLDVIDDGVYEGSQAAIIALDADTDYNLDTSNSATIDITDNDKPSIKPQPKQEWLKQFGTFDYDGSSGVTTDSSGNVYLTGATKGDLAGTNAGSSDVWVAKYDNTGRQLWKQQFGSSKGDYSNGIKTDSSGNVYLTGSGDGDAWIAKYDNTGRQLWKQQFSSSGWDSSDGIAIDSNGYVYVAGSTDGDLAGTNAGDLDGWVAKYDSTGKQLWKQQLGTSDYDYASGVATDKDGNIYLTGSTSGNLAVNSAGDGDAWVAKYDSTGKQLWKQQFGSSGWDDSTGIATDTKGNVYLTGYTDGELETGDYYSDAWVTKYDSTGKQLWNKRFDSLDWDGSFGVATDSNDNVYLTGRAWGDLYGVNAGSCDVWVSKYDPNGKEIWNKQFGSYDTDYSWGIATDSSKNVYVTGSTDGTLGEESFGEKDAWVVKLSQPILPKVTISATDNKAGETITGQTSNPGKFTITRAGDTTDSLTVKYTVGGKATNGNDYTKLTGSATIPAGKTQVVVSLKITDDLVTESTESAILTLTANPSYSLGTSKSATVNIFDNEKPVVVMSAVDSNAAETKIGETSNPGKLKVSRLGDLSIPLIVNRKVSGTATKDTDYKFPNQISLAAGASSITLPMNIIDDALVEGLETATFTLTAGTTYKLSSTRVGTVNIADND
jgi:hypothetical protein